MIHTALALLLALSSAPAADAPGRPYYDCMLKRIAAFAKKTEKSDEAISASQAACHKERLDLETTFIVRHVQDGASGRDAEAIAIRAMEKLDASYHNTYIKAFLDARPSR